MIFLVVVVGWWIIGAYVAWAAFKGGFFSTPLTPPEWLLACVAWPWLIYLTRKVNQERERLQPFEDWAEKYDQEQIDKRLDDLKEGRDAD
jgi:hypothetical protein